MDAADKIKRLNRLYAVASGINEAMVRVPEEQRLYEEACRIAVERGEFLMAWIGLDDPVTGTLRPVARWGQDGGYIDAIRISTNQREKSGMGPGGTAFRTGKPAVCNDIAADQNFFAFRQEALARGFRSCAAFPLQLAGRPAGVFFVYAGEPLYFDEGELAMLASLAENFSFAIAARRQATEGQRIGDALRQSEARLRAVIDNEPECIKSVAADGTILDINPAGLQMVEAPDLASVLGRHVLDYIHPEDRAAHQALHQRVLAGGTGHVQVRAIASSGRMLWMDSHAVPLPAEDGKPGTVLYVTRDITRERASLERLRHSQGLLAMASRLGRIGAWEVELPSMATTWSDELGVILETPPGLAPTIEHGLSFYTPASREIITTLMQECLTRGTPFDTELDVVTARGRHLVVRAIGEAVRDACGTIRRLQGALQDISERRTAENEIRTLAERLTATLESITDALVTVDRNWRFTYVNHEAERVLRRRRTELLGANMWEEFPESRGTVFQEQYERALREGHTVQFEEYYPPLGRWLEIHAFPSDQGLTIYFRDVSDQVHDRQEILRLNAELEQRVRLRTTQLESANAELQAFSYSVAHDLRAPLAAISGFGLALSDELGEGASARSRHYLSRIREGAHRTGEMIDALLSLAQLSRTELRWEGVDLSAMAQAVAEACRQQAPARAAQWRIEPDLRVQGDPRLLRLVLDNLMGNAWKFSEGRDPSLIEVGSTPLADGSTAYFVRDNGVGFDMQYARNLFGAFQRLHSQAEFSGTGIGLANVRRIVTRHGGKVWAESAPEQGATFYFTTGTEPA